MPSRWVADEMSRFDDPNKSFQPFEPSTEMQYVNPRGHRLRLDTIVESDLPVLREKFASAMAISLRVDGSVDRFQEDNKFVMAKLIRPDGTEQLVFLGFDQATARGADGEQSSQALANLTTSFRVPGRRQGCHLVS